MNSTKTDTRTKIKQSAIGFFNETSTMAVSTNQIAKAIGISSGNLHYHFKNKESLVKEIYLEMSAKFESFNGFEMMLTSDNPLKTLSIMFDYYGELFWEYRFLMRDASALMAYDPELKKNFMQNQEKRIIQITGLVKFLISEEILQNIPKEEIELRSKSFWFVPAYWQIFAATYGGVDRTSLQEAKDVIFKIHIYPFLTERGWQLLSEI